MPKIPAAFDESGKVVPAPEDWERVEREYGPLPGNANERQRAERFWTVQSAALIRLCGPKHRTSSHR